MTGLLLQHLIVTTLLAALVWTVCKLAKPSPAAKHILWSLVMLKLLIPPMGEVGVALPVKTTPIALESTAPPRVAETTPSVEEFSIPPQQAPSAPVETATPISTTPIQWEGEAPAEPLRQPQVTSTSTISSASTTPEQTTPAPVPTPINWTALVFAAWITGATLMAAIQLLRWQRFAAQTSVSASTPEWLQSAADTLASQLDCAGTPVAVCNRLSTPAVAGVFRPRILVPQALLERVPQERWRALLAHELAHVKRKDTWWRALELACGVAWFWNPVYWFARKHARAAAEHACDAWVVWALPEERRAYADSLVDVSEWASTPSLPATAIGMSAANKAKLEARLTSIVSGCITRRTSRTMRVAAAALLALSLPGWAIQVTNQSPPDVDTPTESSAPAPPTESAPVVTAQAETEAAPAPREQSRADHASEEVKKALNAPVSIEFDDEYVGNILEFLMDYVGVNILLDHSVVGQETVANVPPEMDVVHVGPHWYQHPTREHLGIKEWPESQAVDGMVGPYDEDAKSAKAVLDDILPDAGMTYAVTPTCIWITVAKPQFEIQDPSYKPEDWVWAPFDRANYGVTKPVSYGISALTADFESRSFESVPFHVEREHISTVVERLLESFRTRTVAGSTHPHRIKIPPIVIDAAAIAPPQHGEIPKSYLVISDERRARNLRYAKLPPVVSPEGVEPSSPETLMSGGPGKRQSPVTSGLVPFIKLEDVPLSSALDALCRPLNLSFEAGPGFIYVSSPERLAKADFADSPVPADQIDLGKALDAPVSIEFDDEHVGTILEFIADYVGINIVLDSRAVIPEESKSHSTVGTNPVTDGIVPFVKIKDLRLADALKALLTPLGLDYSVGPGYIWVSSPEYIARETKTAQAQTEPAPAPPPVAVSKLQPFAAPTRPVESAPALPVHAPTESVPATVEEPMRQPQPEPAPASVPAIAPSADPQPVPVLLAAVEARPVSVLPPVQTTPAINGVKFRRITRWEDSDPRVELEFPDGERKWYEVGDRFGSNQVADINIIDNQVTVIGTDAQGIGTARVLQLREAVQPRDSRVPRSQRAKRSDRTGDYWTKHGGVRFGRIARWEDQEPPGGPWVQVELDDGTRRWLGDGDMIGDLRIVAVNLQQGTVTVSRNGRSESIDLYKPEIVESGAVAATESNPARRGPSLDGYEFRRITRWEESREPRVGVVHRGRLEWYEIGQSAGPIKIEDIDVISNQVIVNSKGELRVLQLAWPLEDNSGPAPRSKRAAAPTSQWTWTPIPYGGVKFGGIARWENSRDARVHVEYPNGTRKWVEVGAAIGDARIGAINVVSNQVTVRTPEGESRTFDLPRPVHVAPASPVRATESAPKSALQKKWTPVKFGNITFGRIARWEENRDPRVQIELPDGERKWFDEGQTAAGVKIIEVNVLRNRLTVERNGKTEAVQLPWVTR